MIEIRTDWVNEIEYEWADFLPVLTMGIGLLILGAYAFYKIR